MKKHKERCLRLEVLAKVKTLLQTPSVDCSYLGTEWTVGWPHQAAVVVKKNVHVKMETFVFSLFVLTYCNK